MSKQALILYIIYLMVNINAVEAQDLAKGLVKLDTGKILSFEFYAEQLVLIQNHKNVNAKEFLDNLSEVCQKIEEKTGKNYFILFYKKKSITAYMQDSNSFGSYEKYEQTVNEGLLGSYKEGKFNRWNIF